MNVHYKINMKVLSDFSKSTSKQLNLVADYIIKNKTKFLVGTVGSGLLIDDLRLRYKSRQYRKIAEKRNLHVKNVMLKQDTKIKTYQSQIEKVPELLEVNKQLRHALAEQGGKDNA